MYEIDKEAPLSEILEVSVTDHVGISFNNSNWPYILKYLRFWCTASMASIPLFYWLFFATAGYLNLNNLNVLWILEIFLVLYLISLFAPMYYLGRKYQ